MRWQLITVICIGSGLAGPIPQKAEAGEHTVVPAGDQLGEIALAGGTVNRDSAIARWGKAGGRGYVVVGIHSWPAGLEAGHLSDARLRIPRCDVVWTADDSAAELNMLVSHIDAADDTTVTQLDGTSAALGAIGVYRSPGPRVTDGARFVEFNVTDQLKGDLEAGRGSFAWRIAPESVPDDVDSQLYFPGVDNEDGFFTKDNRGPRLVIRTKRASTPDLAPKPLEDGQVVRDGDGSFVLKVQRRVVGTDGQEKLVRDTWELSRDEVAFVTMHLWNYGDDDGVPVPKNLCVADGTRDNALRARKIDYLYVKPALDAARQSGMTVIHARPGWIAARYKQHQALVAEMTGTPEQPVHALPPQPEYSDEQKAQWTADTWPDREYLDFPTTLKPLDTEPVVMTKEEFDYLLKKRGIKTLIYVGYATNCCVTDYHCGLKDMVKKLGYRACVLREATLATECEGEDGVKKTAEALALIEREYGATASAGVFKKSLQPPRTPIEHNFLSSHMGWSASVPGQNYYTQEISDQLMRDWKDYFAYMKETGWHEIGIWCFLTYNYPVPLGVDTKGIGPNANEVRITSEKVRRCRELIRSAHENGVKLHYGLTIYSWSVKDIGDVYPETRPGGRVLCGMYPGNPEKGIPSTQQMMKDVVDFTVEQLPEIDGFWVSSGDHGRCKCEGCLAKFPDTLRGRMEYFAATDIPILKHIRSKHPDKTIAYATEVLNEAMEHPDNYDILEQFVSSVDIHLWGNLYPDADKIVKRVDAACPETKILFYQRPWQSTPPADQERDGWFMPNLVHPLGEDIHRRRDVIHWDGIMGCPLPKDNPGDTISMRFMIRMMNHAYEDPVIVAKELLDEWYAPANLKALDELYEVFTGVELAFRKHWPTWFMHIDMVPTSSYLKWTPMQAVDYVNANQLALARLRAIKPELDNQAETERLETSILNWITYMKMRMERDWNYEMP